MDLAAKQKARKERRAKRKALQVVDETKTANREARRARRAERRARQALVKQRAILAPQTSAEIELALKILGLDASTVGAHAAAIALKTLYIDLPRAEARTRAQKLVAALIDHTCIIYRTNPGEEPTVYRVMLGANASSDQCAQTVELIDIGFRKPKEKAPVPMAELEKVLLLWKEEGVDPRMCELVRRHLQERKANG